MDVIASAVARARLVGGLVGSFIALLSTAGCGSKEEPAAKVVKKPAPECEATAHPNKFIVHWRDGSMSVESARSRDSLIRDVIEPNLESIEYAEHDQVIRLRLPARDVSITVTGAPDANWGQDRIEAPAAWDKGVEGNGIIVAVIDSGTELSHDQLKNQLAVNSAEIADNGKDDDENGYVDDVNGFDFFENTGKVMDGTGHGTHVAGIIVAEHGAGSIKGIAPKAKLIPLDFMNDYGEGHLSDAIKAMRYAVARGAKVINASWGGAPCSLSLREEIQRLEGNGVLFVSASGNGDIDGRGVDLDTTPTYPSAYGLSGQINVGASSKLNRMTGFSNYSRKLVNLLAPGVNIASTYVGNTTLELDGTSMAAPFVSGAAALLMSFRPNATIEQVKAALLNSVDEGDYPVSSNGRLNVRRALEEIARVVP